MGVSVPSLHRESTDSLISVSRTHGSRTSRSPRPAFLGQLSLQSCDPRTTCLQRLANLTNVCPLLGPFVPPLGCTVSVLGPDPLGCRQNVPLYVSEAQGPHTYGSSQAWYCALICAHAVETFVYSHRCCRSASLALKAVPEWLSGQVTDMQNFCLSPKWFRTCLEKKAASILGSASWVSYCTSYNFVVYSLIVAQC